MVGQEAETVTIIMVLEELAQITTLVEEHLAQNLMEHREQVIQGDLFKILDLRKKEAQIQELQQFQEPIRLDKTAQLAQETILLNQEQIQIIQSLEAINLLQETIHLNLEITIIHHPEVLHLEVVSGVVQAVVVVLLEVEAEEVAEVNL